MYLIWPVLLSTVLAAAALDFKSTCEGLRHDVSVPGTTIFDTKFIQKGTNLTLQDNDPSCDNSFQLVTSDLCRVTLYSATSSASGVHSEVWLPQDWKGRLLMVGNGGLSGCIYYKDINYGANLGFATVGTNTGHNGSSGRPLFNNPDVLKDFSHNAIHVGSDLGKQLARAMYQHDIRTSIFLGCSTGGRQGFQSAQMYPEDFDGIIAGCPAIGLSQLNAWMGYLGLQTGFNLSDPAFLDEEDWRLVHESIMEQCDSLDGAADGIIESPDVCVPALEGLLCTKERESRCLTKEQLHRANAIFHPLRYPDGGLIFPRAQPGSELRASAIYLNGKPNPMVNEYFRYAIHGNPVWDVSSLTMRDVEFAVRTNPFNINTWEPDLSAFKSSGRKLLHYQGSDDIGAENSARYYEDVKKEMNLTNKGMDEFYRFFPIGGMGHCRGGSGAWMIGQDEYGMTTSDPQNNILMAMAAWIEDDQPPETVSGWRFDGDNPRSRALLERQHCRYPSRNKYIGPDPPNQVEGWACQE